jgi:hypothetical protein
MKPQNYSSEEFQIFCHKLTAHKGYLLRHDSDGKNAVVYSLDKSVFFPVRREYQHESEEMFLWQILFPEDIIHAAHPEIFHIEEVGNDIGLLPNIIWSGKSPKGQIIYWIDNSTSSGIFFAEFDLGGKLFWEQVIPCQEELVKISSEIVRE